MDHGRSVPTPLLLSAVWVIRITYDSDYQRFLLFGLFTPRVNREHLYIFRQQRLFKDLRVYFVLNCPVQRVRIFPRNDICLQLLGCEVP